MDSGCQIEIHSDKKIRIKNVRIMNIFSETIFPAAAKSFKFVFNLSFYVNTIKNNNNRCRIKNIQD